MSLCQTCISWRQDGREGYCEACGKGQWHDLFSFDPYPANVSDQPPTPDTSGRWILTCGVHHCTEYFTCLGTFGSGHGGEVTVSAETAGWQTQRGYRCPTHVGVVSQGPWTADGASALP